MGFNLVARPYALMERLVFGSALQRARCAYLEQIASHANVLLLGDGDGRFLEALLAVPGAKFERIVSVDASERMLALARQRVGDDPRVEWIGHSVEEFCPPADFHADVVVAHFFFDCFTDQELDKIVPRIGRWTAEPAEMVVTEFAIPPGGRIRRMLARLLIWKMVLFFRVTAGISARKLADFHPRLEASGWGLQARNTFRVGLIEAQVWLRSSAETP